MRKNGNVKSDASLSKVPLYQDVGGSKRALFKGSVQEGEILAKMDGYDMIATFAGGQMTVRYDGVMGIFTNFLDIMTQA